MVITDDSVVDVDDAVMCAPVDYGFRAGVDGTRFFRWLLRRGTLHSMHVAPLGKSRVVVSGAGESARDNNSALVVPVGLITELYGLLYVYSGIVNWDDRDDYARDSVTVGDMLSTVLHERGVLDGDANVSFERRERNGYYSETITADGHVYRPVSYEALDWSGRDTTLSDGAQLVTAGGNYRDSGMLRVFADMFGSEDTESFLLVIDDYGLMLQQALFRMVNGKLHNVGENWMSRTRLIIGPFTHKKLLVALAMLLDSTMTDWDEQLFIFSPENVNCLYSRLAGTAMHPNNRLPASVAWDDYTCDTPILNDREPPEPTLVLQHGNEIILTSHPLQHHC